LRDLSIDNVKRDFKGIGCEGVDWIQVAQKSMAGHYEHGNEPSGSLKSRKFLDQLSNHLFLKTLHHGIS
jgi:hypothetical protein